MIIPSLGKMEVKTALTAGATVSTNVIQIPAVDWGAMTNVWWYIQTTTIGSGSGTLTFDLVMGDQVGLDGTNVSVVRTYLSGQDDIRAATVGRFITTLNLGNTLKEMLEESGSDYPFIGLISTLSSSAAISINATLSFTQPHTIPHRMVTDSPIDNSIDVASIGSGA